MSPNADLGRDATLALGDRAELDLQTGVPGVGSLIRSVPREAGENQTMGHCKLPGKRISKRNKEIKLLGLLPTVCTEGGTWRSC